MRLKILAVIKFFGLVNLCHAEDQTNHLIASKPYLGQELPGKTPQLFAPGIISIEGRYEFGIAFSPDLTEIYFSANKKGEISQIFFTRQMERTWSKIQKISLTKREELGELHPFISHDGQRLYFSTHDFNYDNNNNWFVTRDHGSWVSPEKLSDAINNDEVFDVSEAANGDLYYTNVSKMRMYTAKKVAENYSETNEIGIHSGIHGFISPSQDFIIVDDRNHSRKDKDLYVYFKKDHGNWGEPIALGDEINTPYNETVPSITPDGKYLFFSRYNESNGLSNFYWVSSEVIEELRPEQ
ncbi:MAG: PD40 domain-containing protein [Gammaproteobacteria bacterium]|nr:PD40 domain-containing protein [Gammaproteobacteria bacterium]